MRLAETIATDTSKRRGCVYRVALSVVVAAVILLGAVACSGEESGAANGGSSDNVTGGINTAVIVGDATITIESLQAAFQPAAPPQRLSDEALVAPASGVTFYQAIVLIENNGQSPLRVDPEDFFCQIDNVLTTIEPTRSGPAARSLIYGTSLSLTLTFRGATGADPTLIYNPPWYSGLIMFSANTAVQGSGSVGGSQSGSTTTIAPVIE